MHFQQKNLKVVKCYQAVCFAPLTFLTLLLVPHECFQPAQRLYCWRFQSVVFLQSCASVWVNVCPEICNYGLPPHKPFQSAGCHPPMLLLSLCLLANVGCALSQMRDNPFLPRPQSPDCFLPTGVAFRAVILQSQKHSSHSLGQRIKRV